MAEEDIEGQGEGKHDIPDYILTQADKAYLLAVDRGDVPTVREMLEAHKKNPADLNINCTDPLMRTALVTAIENENMELVTALVEGGCAVQDALLHAISEEFVEAVEFLLNWEEENHQEGTPYSWESVDRESANFTADITPLILAAHRNNYEILKTLLDRGATLPMPHDVRCGCDDCVQSSQRDSLRHSQARINAYRALSSSSLIALSSKDPILTAFELSWELGRLSKMESEFKLDYVEMRMKTMEFGCSLLDHVRFSHELEVMLNFNPSATTDIWEPGDRQTLSRLKQAIKFKQKLFIAHPNVQQLLAAIWYDGLPGFRRLSMIKQLIEVAKLGAQFPVYSMIYIMAPDSEKGKLCKKPFVQFILASASYAFFLMLLAAATQRIEYLALEFIGTPWMLEILEDWKRRERGSIPGPIELFIIMYIGSIVFAEIKALWDDGLLEYITDLWNIVDFIANFFYVTWIMLRAVAWLITLRESWSGINPYYPREEWDIFDPMLISEGSFAAGMILSFLKLVHIFSINPHMGPLQVSLGRMIMDIIKFFFIYTLVLFAFGCGLNQMLFYYANLEKQKCYPDHTDIPDFDNNEKACSIWRRFANLFETSQSLFWASFGLVDLMAFDLEGIKGFTRFWALLMFGSYSVINIIVLLNMLIAMMSNSYQIISERSDVEWKFARSQLWMSYFEDGNTLPIPFNLCPTVKILRNMKRTKQRTKSFIRRSLDKALKRHDKVMYLLIRRFVTAEQSKREDSGVTEDDIMEVRQDISTLRFELIDILKKNGMKTPEVDPSVISGKKGRQMERRIQKDFQIGFVAAAPDIAPTVGSKEVFSSLAKMMLRQKSQKDGARMAIKSLSRKNTISGDPIGSRRTSLHRHSLRRQILEDANKGLRPNACDLLEYNPQLAEVTQTTRVAMVKFIAKTIKSPEKRDESQVTNEKGVRSIVKQSTIHREQSKDVPKKSSLKTSSIAKQEQSESKVTDPEVNKQAEATAKTSPTLKGKAPAPPPKVDERPQKSADPQPGTSGSAIDSDGGKKAAGSDGGKEAPKEEKKQEEKKEEEKKPDEKQPEEKKDQQSAGGSSGDSKEPSGDKGADEKKPGGGEDSKESKDKKKKEPEKRTRAAPVEGTTDRGKSTVTGKTVSGWL